METLVAILIYLGVLTSPGEYKKSDLNKMASQYRSEIAKIQQNDDLVNSLLNSYKADPFIVVIDDSQMK